LISYRLLAVLLATLSALGPFSIDTYLPAFPEMGQSLGATPLQVQQTLTAYLLPFAIMTLWHGALSDALGRRRVILWALVLFGLASVGCTLATSIEQLWFFRALQGMTAGAGIVVGRAVVRDVFQGAEAQRLMAHVAIMFALAPAIAPIIGGWLHVAFGWRSIFLFLVLATALLLAACWRWLPETLAPETRQPLHPGYLMGAYRAVLTSPGFLSASLAISFNFLGFFIYVMSAPVFLMQHLGRSETEFYWLFGPAMAGLMGGSWISGHLAGRITPRATALAGYVLMGLGAAINLAVSFGLPPGIPWSVVHLLVYNVGMAMAMPCLTLMALDLFPRQRGLAASCQTFLQAGMNTVAAALLAPLLWDTTRHLALGSTLLLALGLACTLLHLGLPRRTPAI
jgi:DHA1 family bicyclomycin/chloramphenicol resistance-like MFS transporter